jgi:hypothetical protein
MEFTNFKRELQTLNYAELNMLISDIMLEIKKRSYNEGMVKAMTSFGSSEEEVSPVETEMDAPKSPQQIRDEIVEKAKADIERLLSSQRVKSSFVINKEKRTIVALVPDAFRYPIKIRSRGIAKCDPTDCFNVHIGKAIALRRALGLEVPTEYLNAPQPTEVRVGDVVHKSWWKITDPYEVTEIINNDAYDSKGEYASLNGLEILDDSRVGVTE